MFRKSFLYRFRFPCAHIDWDHGKLDETYQLPHAGYLGSPVQPSSVRCEFRIGWNDIGLRFSFFLFGKKQSLWCRATQPDESDGIQICIDTRDIKDIHRASRFCHRLFFMPIGSGKDSSQPLVMWLPIQRAKEHPQPIDLSQIKMSNKVSADGYQLDVALPGKVLTGFDPLEYSNLGFHFSIMDRELGDSYFLVSPPLPHDQDPSLWGTLSMVKE